MFDQFSDPGYRFLYQLVQTYPESESHIKEASLDPEENEKRADDAFAWRERRMFPIDDPAQASLSRLYMQKQGGIPKHVVETCDKALSIYGIDLPLTEKNAAAVDDSGDYIFPEIRRLRVVEPDDVKLAAESICSNRRKMDTPTKVKASVRLTKKAVFHKTKLPVQILKYAGMTISDTRALRDWLEVRSNVAEEPTVKEAFTKLAERVFSFPALCGDRGELVKVASVVDELDRAAGIDRLYGATLLDPLETVFNTDKVAEDMAMLAGKQVPESQLLSIDPDIYRDVFGPDIVDEFVTPEGDIDLDRFRVILPTVPYDLQNVLAKQLGL